MSQEHRFGSTSCSNMVPLINFTLLTLIMVAHMRGSVQETGVPAGTEVSDLLYVDLGSREPPEAGKCRETVQDLHSPPPHQLSSSILPSLSSSDTYTYVPSIMLCAQEDCLHLWQCHSGPPTVWPHPSFASRASIRISSIEYLQRSS